MKAKNASIYIVFVIATLVVVNIISDKLFVRLDLTEDNRYTLSNATKDIIKNLDEPVTITAYFSENLPPDVAKTRRDFKELLTEYRNISKNGVMYEFIDPNADEESEQEAMSKGIQPVLINVREKDQVKQQKAFLGAVIQKGDKSEVIPFMQPGTAMEYALSSGIKKITVDNKPTIGFLQGHGEPALNEMQQAMTELGILYNTVPVNLAKNPDALSGVATLAIVAPSDSISEMEFAAIDNFMSQGGRIYVAMNRVKGELQQQQGMSLTTGLETWLNNKNLVVDDNFVIDANCATIGVQQRQGFFSFQSQVQFPYIPIVKNFADHPITGGLEQVVMQFVSTITYTGDSTKTFTPLVMTTESAGTLSSPLYFDIQKEWQKSDFPLAELPVGGLIEGSIVGNTYSKMVVIADGDFAVNGAGQQARQQNPDNINLMVNSIDFLSDDTGLIELRTKGITSRPIDELEAGRKSFLKWLNLLLPIVLIIIIGFVRSQQQRSLRYKRMEEGYV
ncbi:MAG: Gldg family protein [Salinivirgaceae bacterium]|nr:Gldg family protein [Salinivirgaceae bacterium]